ncbi:MAG: YggT family protein [Simkaniaceae bacterium]|nr:YggT family protein [Simkaniaceae bacterium]
MIAYMIHLLFLSYTMMLFARIIGSWFPKFAHTTFMRFIAHYTDPYLNLFRRFIPPIGGVLDLSPLIGFFVLRFGERLVLGFFR